MENIHGSGDLLKGVEVGIQMSSWPISWQYPYPSDRMLITVKDRLPDHEWHYQGQVGHGAWRVSWSAGFPWNPHGEWNACVFKKTKDVSVWLEAGMQQYFVKVWLAHLSPSGTGKPASTCFQVMRLEEDDESDFGLWWWDQAFGARGQWKPVVELIEEVADNGTAGSKVTIASGFPKEQARVYPQVTELGASWAFRGLVCCQSGTARSG